MRGNSLRIPRILQEELPCLAGRKCKQRIRFYHSISKGRQVVADFLFELYQLLFLSNLLIADPDFPTFPRPVCSDRCQIKPKTVLVVRKQVSWQLSEARVSGDHESARNMSAWLTMQSPSFRSASQKFRRGRTLLYIGQPILRCFLIFSGLDHAYCMHLLPTLLLICRPLDQPLINNKSILFRLRRVHGFPCRLSIPRTAGTTSCCGVLQHAMVVHQFASHNRTLAALGSCTAIETLWAAMIWYS